MKKKKKHFPAGSSYPPSLSTPTTTAAAAHTQLHVLSNLPPIEFCAFFAKFFALNHSNSTILHHDSQNSQNWCCHARHLYIALNTRRKCTAITRFHTSLICMLIFLARITRFLNHTTTAQQALEDFPISPQLDRREVTKFAGIAAIYFNFFLYYFFCPLYCVAIVSASRWLDSCTALQHTRDRTLTPRTTTEE